MIELCALHLENLTPMHAMPTTNKVYELKHTYDHLFDGHEHDVGLLEEFSNCRAVTRGFFYPIPITVSGHEGVCERKQNANGKWHVTKLQIPDSAKYWWGVESDLQETDYPVSEQRWPIMSTQMLEVLLSIREFPHQAIPIDIQDCEWVFNHELGRMGYSGIHNHNFVILQLLEQLDIFDKENSIYDPDRIVGGIETMVFKEPTTGFPPIFRVSDHRTQLYVSAEARTAMEKEGIRGVKFKELEGA